ncbi:hypothetical protein BpHYR1_037885, partial [Brachionus plicatilis]
MSYTESSSTSILVTQRNEEDTSCLLQPMYLIKQQKQRAKTEWFSFDDYIKEINSFRFVKFNQEVWESSLCSCPYWDKNLICKHVIGVAYRLKLCEFPGLRQIKSEEDENKLHLLWYN